MNVLKYFNPVATGFHSVNNFNNKLSLANKFKTIVFVVVATLVSIPILGLGGLAAFRLCAERFSRNAPNNRGSEKAAMVGNDILGRESENARAAAAAGADDTRTPGQILHEMNNFFEEITKDPKKLYGEQGEILAQDIDEFEIQFGLYKITEFNKGKDTHSSEGKQYLNYKLIKEQFYVLRSMRQGLFITERTIDKEGVIKEPDKGDCLFCSALDGLRLIADNILPDEICDEHDLRKEVAEWMKENINSAQHGETLKGFIAESIDDYQTSERRAIRNEKASLEALKEAGENVLAEEEKLQEKEALVETLNLDTYFERIAEPGFFGSTAEIYAISKIFNVTVEVQVKLNGEFVDSAFWRKINQEVENQDPSRVLRIVHTNGNHFDARVAD